MSLRCEAIVGAAAVAVVVAAAAAALVVAEVVAAGVAALAAAEMVAAAVVVAAAVAVLAAAAASVLAVMLLYKQQKLPSWGKRMEQAALALSKAAVGRQQQQGLVGQVGSVKRVAAARGAVAIDGCQWG